jgi:hypothetical protein
VNEVHFQWPEDKRGDTNIAACKLYWSTVSPDWERVTCPDCLRIRNEGKPYGFARKVWNSATQSFELDKGFP